MLLDKGADVNAQGGEYGNALYAASAGGHDKIVQLLLDKEEGYDKIVQLLLDKGADVNAQSGHYGNALYAASVVGYDKIVQLLLDKGADVNAQGGGYGNALQAASAQGHEKIVQLLLERQTRLTANTMFLILTKNLRTAIPLMLPQLETNMVFWRDADHNKTLLHWAAELGYRDLTNRCLDLGAEVEATDKYGETALHYAAENGHLNIVKKLVQANVDRTALDSLGRTALDCARGGGPGDGRSSHQDIVAYLQQ
ncbi:hypothetical protein D6C78_11057 [Aureobasidium pullulans]|uniref:Uncharacterized protein n=1 Tax=Aureobasidium pullulans TaxID=5580 RepID=A0A4T0B108_AURPU|nr:hypothetical protein D6C78_11057 [Aureobasidium pullulans]